MTKEKTFKEVAKEIKAEAKTSLYDESEHWIKFNYLEQEGQEVQFTFGKTVEKPGGKRKNVYEEYKMKDGGVYKIPQYIIDHLNSKEVPDPKLYRMANGSLRADVNRKKNRFALVNCQPPANIENAPKALLSVRG